MGERRGVYKFWWENQMERDHLEDQIVDGKMTKFTRLLTTRVGFEKCVVRGFRRFAKMYLDKPRQYSLLHTYAIRYSLLLLGHKPYCMLLY
jgi:hypothetical protein